MSATNRGGQRSPADFYATPAWCVRRFLERCTLPRGRWLEPTAGEGHLLRAVASVRPALDWTAVELRPECAPLLDATGARVRVGNFLSADREWLGLHGAEEFDVAIGNPPFRYALECIEAARRVARITAMLLRLDFLESDERAEFLRAWTPDVYVLPDRPSFTGEGTDSTAYGWFVWRWGWRTSTAELHILDSTPLAERKAPTLYQLPAPVVEQRELFA